MTYRQFVDYLKQRQRLRAVKMKQPEDEWWPEAHFAGASVRTVPIPTGFFQDRGTKRMLVDELLVPTIRTSKVRLFGLQLVMYMLSSDNPDPIAQNIMGRGEYDPEGIPNFADVPGRIEVVHIIVWDAERAESHVAEITRPEKGAPKLGEWRMGDMDTLGGPMFDPIAEALR